MLVSIHPFFYLSILKRELEIKRTISNKNVCLESLVAMVHALIINVQEKKHQPTSDNDPLNMYFISSSSLSS